MKKDVEEMYAERDQRRQEKLEEREFGIDSGKKIAQLITRSLKRVALNVQSLLALIMKTL